MIRWEERRGEPIYRDDVVVVPQSKALVVRLPFGGLVWNRPTAVLVTQNNQTTTIPISDPTRLALWTLAGVGVMVALLMRLKE